MLWPLPGSKRPLVVRLGPAAAQEQPRTWRGPKGSAGCGAGSPAYKGPRAHGRGLRCLMGVGLSGCWIQSQRPTCPGSESWAEDVVRRGKACAHSQGTYTPRNPGGASLRWRALVNQGESRRGEGVMRPGRALRHAPPCCVCPAAPDPCASGPCLNGGSCSSTQDPESYHCACPVAFTGKDCGTGERGGGLQGRGAPAARARSRGSLCRPQRNALTRAATSTWRWAIAGPACTGAEWNSASVWGARSGARAPATQVRGWGAGRAVSLGLPPGEGARPGPPRDGHRVGTRPCPCPSRPSF